jgi:RNA polymerase primary sigma factor
MRQLTIAKNITPRDTASLDKYLNDISKEGMINMEEEVRLAQLIQQGDEVAKEKLVKANLRFVVSVAKQYQGKGLSLQDLINEGNIGLIKAAGRFDEKRGFKFISYAVWWIRQSIISALSEQCRIVRLPLNRISILNKINRAKSVLQQKFGREPDIQELSDLLDIPKDMIADTLRSSGGQVSLDAPFSDNEDSCLLDLIQDKDASGTDSDLMNESLKEQIRASVSALSEREATVLQLLYGINDTQVCDLTEIGIRMNLSSERIRQIKKVAIRKLQEGASGKILQNYL